MTRALALAAALSLAPVAHADATETLARVAVLEAGFRSEVDHAAIWSVLRRRADRAGWPIERMAIAYSSPVRRGHWPAWAADAPASAWERVRARAAAFLAGKVPNPCPGALHWGDAYGDKARATRAGWRRVWCRGAVNLFWAP